MLCFPVVNRHHYSKACHTVAVIAGCLSCSKLRASFHTLGQPSSSVQASASASISNLRATNVQLAIKALSSSISKVLAAGSLG